MKRLCSLFLAMILILTSFSLVSFAAEEIKIVINDKEVSFDQMPVIVDGRTLVPLRGISETLGAEVLYTADTKRVTVSRDGVVVKLKIGSTEAYVDRTEKTLDVPATVISDRTMVPVRFISEAYGSDVKWDGDTKTVIITDNGTSKGVLAPLKSEFHRPVPTTFEKSNKIDDILHFDSDLSEENPLPDASLGTVILDGETLFSGGFTIRGPEHGSVETYKDEQGVLVLKVTSNARLEKTADFIIKPKVEVDGEVKEEDNMLMMFDIRCASTNVDTGEGSIQIQLEETTSGKYKKAVFDKVTCPPQWKTICLPCGGVADAKNFGIRAGFEQQVVEIKNFKLINYKTNVKMEDLPKTSYSLGFLQPGAQWREDAFKRIEEIRKGDFTVVVKDKDGNIIPDAEVELDMFEHQFEFGSSTRNQYYENETAMQKLSENFNSSVCESQMKWGPWQEFEVVPRNAELFVQKTTEAGMKYLRGHTLVWEVDGATASGNRMVPQAVQDIVKSGDKEKTMAEIDRWFEDVLPKFRGRLVDWDVVNEIIKNKLIANLIGEDTLYTYYFAKARDLDPTVDLYYNEARAYTTQDEYFRLLDLFEEKNVDYDALGIQTHRDSLEALYDMNDVVAFYDKIRTQYNKTLKITEYSCNVSDENIQGNYTRDSLIAAFAEPNMEGFLYWGFWDGSNFAGKKSPFYDEEFNLRPAGQAFQDLVYNKWWTRDAKANTDAEGKAVIRGFYGDYDVTVTANGETVTKMVAFHKNYDNILEITVE